MSAKDLPGYRIRCTAENRLHRRFEPEYRHTEAAAVARAELLANRYRVPVVVDLRVVGAVGRAARDWQPTAVRFEPEAQ